MDYFYVSNRATGSRTGVDALSTKEPRKRLTELGKSVQGARNVLVARYKKCREEAGEPDEGEETPVEAGVAAPHAADNPMMVMVDETIGNKYMRRLPTKALEIRVITAGWSRTCTRS